MRAHSLISMQLNKKMFHIKQFHMMSSNFSAWHKFKRTKKLLKHFNLKKSSIIIFKREHDLSPWLNSNKTMIRLRMTKKMSMMTISFIVFKPRNHGKKSTKMILHN